jgi:hypothetical protein
MVEPRKWKATIHAWDVMEITDIEAESEEAAREQALECMRDDYNVEHVDGGVNTVDVEFDEG